MDDDWGQWMERKQCASADNSFVKDGWKAANYQIVINKLLTEE
jgi:hypothetical protein